MVLKEVKSSSLYEVPKFRECRWVLLKFLHITAAIATSTNAKNDVINLSLAGNPVDILSHFVFFFFLHSLAEETTNSTPQTDDKNTFIELSLWILWLFNASLATVGRYSNSYYDRFFFYHFQLFQMFVFFSLSHLQKISTYSLISIQFNSI